MRAPIPHNEPQRLAALAGYDILDTAGEREFDDIVLLASQICGTPIATISLIDENRQWFKAKVGLELEETPRDEAFCAHAIVDPYKTMVVQDATVDERFADNPHVVCEDGIRFYAGAPLRTADDLALGTLCVIDRRPRELDNAQLLALEALARQLTLRLELRRASAELRRANEELQNLSLTDELTGLYNRRGFLLHAEQHLKVFRSRESDRGLWLMVADMDGLKHINDTYGHPEGSRAIKAMGEILRRTLRDADVVARPGGDEFTALLPNTRDDVATSLPDRIRANVDAWNSVSDTSYKLGVSIGLAKADFKSEVGVQAMIDEADQAMYADKKRRKGN